MIGTQRLSKSHGWEGVEGRKGQALPLMSSATVVGEVTQIKETVLHLGRRLSLLHLLALHGFAAGSSIVPLFTLLLMVSVSFTCSLSLLQSRGLFDLDLYALLLLLPVVYVSEALGHSDDIIKGQQSPLQTVHESCTLQPPCLSLR